MVTRILRKKQYTSGVHGRSSHGGGVWGRLLPWGEFRAAKSHSFPGKQTERARRAMKGDGVGARDRTYLSSRPKRRQTLLSFRSPYTW